MNQMIKPDSVDFNALIKNSTVLTLNTQSKMIEILNKEFTQEENRWYIANLYIYMNYHPTNDFPINLETLVKLVGFAHKKNAKRTLENNFTKDEDYKVTVLPKEHGKKVLLSKEQNLNTKDLGGRPEEQVMLNIDTFKNMCMLVKTEKSKEIRKYYVKLENIYNKIIKEEIEEKNEILQKQQNQLNNKQYELEKTQQELKQIEDKKNWLLNRRYNNSKPGDVIYLYKDYKNGDKQCDEFIYKIGKTKNIGEREVEYSNTSKSGKIVYIKYCLNCDLTEKILHHILDKYRLIRNQDESARFDSFAWFTFSEELAIQTIDSIVYLMDFQMETIDVFIPNLYKLLDIDNIKKGEIMEFGPGDKIPIQIKNGFVHVNPKDFDKFIQECCELSGEYKYPKADIKQAHRVWSKCSTKDVISALDNYLKDNFESGVIIENDIKRNVYKGLKLKPSIFNPKDGDNLLDYENFIIEKCKVDWCYRISYVDFFNHFLNWKKTTEPNYKLTHKYKKEIQEYLETVFAGGRVHLSSGSKSNHLFGIWGCGMEFNNFGLKTPERTCKRVCQYNSDTNELIKSWDSLSIASRELGIAISSLSNYCRFNNMIGNNIYKYE
jgi:phage anti-repressor protein